jgi:pimeloyl-ACP methyl ester carboxylesterase
MDNDRIRLFGPSTEGHMTIRGGAGGISVQLEELTAGAEKLDALASDLVAVEQEARRILDHLCWVDRQPPWSTSAHLAAIRNGQWRVEASRAELQRISSQVRACLRDYEDAEWRANAGRFCGITSVEEFGTSWATMVATRVPDRRTMESIITMLGLAAPDVRARIDREPFVRDSLMFLVTNFIPRPLAARQEESAQVELEASPAGLLERVRAIDARGPGHLEVLKVDNGGAATYVVVLPGTQSAGMYAGGDNPFDEAGILEGMLYGSEEINQAVLDALASAGAEPHAAVVAVGYSQGGIHAMNLASDPRVLEQYDVKYVLTAGSPVAGTRPREEVSALHLEHEADWVPGSDGLANPETRNRVTVSMSSPVSAQEDKGLGPGHSFEGYQDAARLVADSSDPSLMQSTAMLGSVLGAGGTATATRFSLSRAKGPTPTLAPQEPRAHERGHGGR